jgi:iron complex outermembrane receptor protein
MSPCVARALLLAGTAVSTLPAIGPVQAQTIPVSSPASQTGRKASGSEAITVVGTAGHKSADGVTGLQPGGGLIKVQVAPKSVSTVTNDYIQKQPPAQSPFMLVQLLPGAVVSEVDPWGLSGGSLSLRGLDQTQMAFVWEGMPIADIGVYTTYPSEFGDGENLEELSLQQGSSNIDTPTINGSGGLFTFHDRDPSLKMGGLLDYGYGTYKYNRVFGRYDTGLIGNSGIRAFVSLSNQFDRAWRGSGTDNKTHLDFKAVKEWGEGNRVSLVGAYQYSVQNSYTNPTLYQWGQLGRSFNYDGTYTYNDLNYYKLNRNPYHNFEMAAPSHFNLTHGVSLDFVPYLWHGYGNGTIGLDAFSGQNFLGAESVNLTVPGAVDGSAPELFAFIDDQYRSGFNSTLNYRTGRNRLYGGWWFDYSNDHDYYTYSPVGANGEPASVWGDRGILKLADGRAFLSRSDDTKTTIHALYLGDEIGFLDDRLKLDFGIKEAIINRDGTNYLPGPQYKAVLNDAQPLPAISAHYQINPEMQLFASVSTNFRSPVNTTLYNQYSYLDGSVSFQGSSNVKDEYSISEELGYRYTGSLLVASASYFHYNFTNRQITTAVPGTNNAVTTDVNAGGQTSDGVNVEAGTRPFFHLRPYVAGQYLHTSNDNDILIGGDLLPTTGKDAVRSPHFVGSVGLDYDDGRFFANWNMRYIGSQYATLTNDEKMPAYYEMGGAVGVRLPDIGPAKSPTLQLNLINLTDNKFLSGINSITPNAKNTVGRYGTLIAGSAPTYNVGEGFAAFATFKIGF